MYLWKQIIAVLFAQWIELNPGSKVTVDVDSLKVVADDLVLPCDMRAGARDSLLNGAWDPLDELLSANLEVDQVSQNLLMFKSLINRTHHKSLVLALSSLSLILCGCLPDSPDRIEPDSFFEELREQSIFPQPLKPEKFPELKNSASGYSPLGIYKSNEIEWALFDLPDCPIITDSSLSRSPTSKFTYCC